MTDGGVAETPAPVITDAVAEAAVDVARIEAERDIALAEIHTEAMTDMAERSDEENIEWLRQTLETLRNDYETQAATLSALAETLALHQGRLDTMEQTQAALILAAAPTIPAEDLTQQQPLENQEGADQEGQGAPEPGAESALDHEPEAPVTRQRRGYLR